MHFELTHGPHERRVIALVRELEDLRGRIACSRAAVRDSDFELAELILEDAAGDLSNLLARQRQSDRRAAATGGSLVRRMSRPGPKPRTRGELAYLAASVIVLRRSTSPPASGASIASVLHVRPESVYRVLRALKAAEKLFPIPPEGLRPTTRGRPQLAEQRERGERR